MHSPGRRPRRSDRSRQRRDGRRAPARIDPTTHGANQHANQQQDQPVSGQRIQGATNEMESTETFWRKGEMCGMKGGKFYALEQPSTPRANIPQSPDRMQERDRMLPEVVDFALCGPPMGVRPQSGSYGPGGMGHVGLSVQEVAEDGCHPPHVSDSPRRERRVRFTPSGARVRRQRATDGSAGASRLIPRRHPRTRPEEGTSTDPEVGHRPRPGPTRTGRCLHHL